MPKVILRGPYPLMSPLGLTDGVGKTGAAVSINGVTMRIPRNEEVDVSASVVAYMKQCGFNVEDVKVKPKSKKGA